jgi:hypothetical protein
MILLAMYLFKLAANVNKKIEKANYYKGWLILSSLVCFFVSIIIHICEAVVA